MGELGFFAGIFGLVGAIVFLAVLFHFVPLGLYIAALASNAKVSISASAPKSPRPSRQGPRSRSSMKPPATSKPSKSIN